MKLRSSVLISCLVLLFGAKLVLACTTTADCPANAKYCNDFNVCEDCCAYDTFSCPTDCTVESGECRNQTGVVCEVVATSEMPAQGWWAAIASVFVIAGIFWWARKQRA